MPTNNPVYMNAYRKKHYAANKKKYIQSAAKRKRRIAACVAKVKERPCADCGVEYPPYVMQFDHVRGKKLFCLARAGDKSLAKIKAELVKCDVVCANCHCIRTHRRRIQ